MRGCTLQASLEQTAEQALDEAIEKYWGGEIPQPGKQPELVKAYYFHTDQVGLPEELTNAQGQIVWQASYKTWGNTIQEQWGWANLDGSRVFEQDKGDMPDEEARHQNLRFQGQYLDRDTGLHYNTFRYYDPDLGRFISPDPIGLMGGINLGSYAPNPISWIDPWGWCSTKLGRNMGARKGDGMANHHLIPEELMNSPGFKTMFDRLKRMGFDPDGAGNGMFLPGSRSMAQKTGLPGHWSNHNNYTAWVRRELNAIKHLNGTQLILGIKDIQSRARYGLENGLFSVDPITGRLN